MNQHLQTILNFIQQSQHLTIEEKAALSKAAKDAAKEIEVTNFKLDSTEKVKRTTAILLEETIEELEQKRKAVEAQNRELEIESALERVRTIAMSMSKPDDMLDVCKIISQQLELLNVKEIRNVQTAIFYESKGTYMNYEYYAKHDKTFITETSYTNHKMPKAFAAQMLKGKGEFFTRFISKAALPDWIAYQKTTNVFIDTFLETASSLSYYWFSLGPVALGISTYEPLKEEETNLFKRFLKVFELAYRRYLDIEQAVAQAREAQIEAALEKVRSHSLAMHKSNELNNVVTVLFERLKELQIPVTAVGIQIYIEGSKDLNVYVCGDIGNGLAINNYRLPYFNHPIANDLYDVHEKELDFFIGNYSTEEKNSFYKYLFEHSALMHLPDDIKNMILQSNHYSITMAPVKNSMIAINDFEGKILSENEADIIKRFAKVFEQAYTRFLDLQKAEAQAREAQIELSLERVRTRAMVMQHSNELGELVITVCNELRKLDFALTRCAIAIMNEDETSWKEWTAEIDQTAQSYDVKNSGYPYHIELLKNWKQKTEKWIYYLHGDEMKNLTLYLISQSGYNRIPEPVQKIMINTPEIFLSHSFHNFGFIRSDGLEPLSETNLNILYRFVKVFEQAYTRFLDLKKAEAQAREAQIEAALERVRSRTLAMQKSDELAETSSVLFKQLIGLGISPNRLYIGIMKDDKGETEFWITDEDGSKVSMAYEDNLNNNPSFKKMFDGWKQQKKSLVIDMKGKELKEYLNYLSSIHVPFKGGVTQKRRVQYIAYFSKGFIGMASPDEQPAETLQLLERFAYVFNLTFTRFNDLQIAEVHAVQAQHDLFEIKAARKKAEETLAELQSTQKQLVQSEKMASLGELTAGIAHEIQNPLNFVNNFSEVSKELLDEMKAALESGDENEAKEIVKDVIQNLEKINHHGKRADAIVKSMLQHSRKSSGQKESTDINALCDEYLRLSYHGLRAKDKSFNADFKTDFDEAIHKINIVPQDMGRVLLNLFNNAFYAVNEKRKNLLGLADLTGLVSVQTKKINDKIEIRVEDNGNGIPLNIIDKIFQPFFTTKPTGQGTGLGLSLAYDIITKEHNGTIKVESKEGAGSRFIIQLPV